jgi:hypothetical protein
MKDTLEQIDWKVFPNHGMFKGLKSAYESWPDERKLWWQQWYRENRDAVADEPYSRLSDIPFFKQWYKQASIAETELWEWEIRRNGIIQEWLLKITTLLFGCTVVAGFFYYPGVEMIQAAQTKRDEARVAVMRKMQLKQLVG